MELYECIVMLDPHLAEDANQKVRDRIQETITSNGGEIVKVDVWGLRRLSYPIQKKNESFYVLYYFKAPPRDKVLSELERLCRIHEHVMRYLVVRSQGEKTAAQQAALVKEAGERATEEPQEAEPKKSEEAPELSSGEGSIQS
ncbi:MAG: 30S ribosomal protein S6 [bacterium]